MASRSWFPRGMALFAMVLATVGFVPGLLAPAHPRQPLTWLVAAHGVACVAWLVFFLAQTSAIAARRTDLHRRAGWIGGVIALALVVTGYYTAIGLARRGIALSGDPATARDPVGELVFPLGDLVTFTILIAAGLVWRRRPATHGRLMLFGTLGGLMPAALSHLVGYTPEFPGRPLFLPASLAVLYAVPGIYDKLTAGRVHPLSLWVGPGIWVWANLRAALIGPSEAWHRFVAWLIA